MKALINFKICDNAPECGGIEVCPTKAMYFDEEKNVIVVDEAKCTNCGLCERECPVGAIMVAKTEEQYQQYIRMIEDDTRTIKDLFVDRYGAVSLSSFFRITSVEVDKKITAKKLTFIEFYDSDIAECLLKSIPIKEITDNLTEDVNYYKLDKDQDLANKYDINEFPTLLIFQNNRLIGKVEGYYSVEEKKVFERKIFEIINKKI